MFEDADIREITVHKPITLQAPEIGRFQITAGDYLTFPFGSGPEGGKLAVNYYVICTLRGPGLGWISTTELYASDAQKNRLLEVMGPKFSKHP